MLHNEKQTIQRLQAEGRIGLELESQRTDRSGRLSRTRHPFSEDGSIVRDFGEAQLEINTDPAETPEAALKALHDTLRTVHAKLREREELLWPFSNPPVIESESDIEIAAFSGPKYQYRRYLANKYGKYQMTYSGIHFNYSFSDELLRRRASLEGADAPDAYRRWKDCFYLNLAEQVLSHSWVVVALLGASPLVDSSFFESGQTGRTVFTGSASLRSGPLGYWNHFSPLLSYESMDEYVRSIQKYIDRGMISQASELYYPVRLKSAGAYSLEGLRRHGADHIELRMIDLNPFAQDGIALDDLRFLQLLLLWLAALPRKRLDTSAQVFALQNHKNAAAYDWSMIRIAQEGRFLPLSVALDEVLRSMESFFADADGAVRSALACQREKLTNPTRRYAIRVRSAFGGDYPRIGLRRAAEIQESFHV